MFSHTFECSAIFHNGENLRWVLSLKRNFVCRTSWKYRKFRVNFALRWCTITKIYLCVRIFGQKRKECHRPSTVLYWYCSMWLFPVPEAKIITSKKVFWVIGGHKKKFVEWAEGHTSISLQKIYGGLHQALHSCIRLDGPTLKATK